MAELLWRKDATVTDAEIMDFLAGDDVLLDRHLFRYDIRASKAHAGGLAAAGLLDESEAAALVTALDGLDEAFVAGDFVLDARFEDGHSAIEAWLTERLGDTGKKIHTGRSRNDQVLVATRLFLLDALAEIAATCGDIARAFLGRASSDGDAPMPGYTHLQHAVVSSSGLWFAGFAEAFIDDAALALSTRRWLSANPLGTTAGFGVNLPLDRAYTTAELGFDRLQVNPMYAQNSRGKFELHALNAALQPMLDLRRFAWDLSLFQMPELGFVTLPDRYTTGSSVMPNKRNPDLVEILRAECATTQAAITELTGLLSLPSGYHRDLQLTKAPVLRALPRALRALRLVPDMVAALTLDRERMAAQLEPAMYATDLAMELSRAGRPFRDAYRAALSDPDALARRTPEESLARRESPGAPGNLMLDTLAERLAALDLPGLRDD